MAILGIGKKKKQTKGRGKARSAAEKLAAEQTAYIKWLKIHDPTEWRAVMKAMLHVTPANPLSDFFATWKGLSEAGFPVPGPKKEGMMETLKDGAIGIFSAFAELKRAAEDGNGQVAVSVQPQHQPEIQYHQPAQLDQAQQTIPAQQEVYMSFLSNYVISKLDGKTPQEAAEWLIAQPQAANLIPMLLQMPQEEIFPYLGKEAQTSPEFAGLIAWLFTRQAWFLETVKVVRSLAEKAPPQAGL